MVFYTFDGTPLGKRLMPRRDLAKQFFEQKTLPLVIKGGTRSLGKYGKVLDNKAPKPQPVRYSLENWFSFKLRGYGFHFYDKNDNLILFTENIISENDIKNEKRLTLETLLSRHFPLKKINEELDLSKILKATPSQ